MQSPDQSVFSKFSSANRESDRRWAEFRSRPNIGIGHGDIPAELVPLHGYPEFRNLTPEEKRNLYLDFTRLNAEGVILFEQLLFAAFRAYKKKMGSRPEAQRALKKLMHEERVHSAAFRRFMKANFPNREESLMLNNGPVKALVACVARAAPLALCIWGAKIEAYSVCYSVFLKKSFGGVTANRWVELNHLHMLDEALHVPFQLDVYGEGIGFIRFFGAIKTVVGVFVLVFAIQFLLLFACGKMASRAFPDFSLLSRLRKTLRIARWCVRDFEPYKQALAKTRALHREKALPFGAWFSFIYW